MYGVAKKATAIAVRVFDSTGKGSGAYVQYSLQNVVHNPIHIIIYCMKFTHNIITIYG